MRCPLQFYYCYVEGLREPDDNDDDTIDNRVFGNIFREATQMLYERIMRSDKRITPDDLDAVIKTKADIEMAVDAAFRKVLFQLTDDKTRMPELNGMQIINREVIVHYLTRLLIIDRQLAPFTIVGLEHDVVQPLAVRSLGITTTIGGRIDRLDCVMENDGPRLRVIDYKTGARRLTPLKSVDDIFNPEQLRNHNDYYLQTLLYARLVRASHPDTPTAPALLFIQHAATDDYDPVLRFGQERINDMATPDGDRFVGLLAEKIEEIFHPDIAFVPTDDRDRCATCPYVSFCGKTTKLHI
jgi:ATP-dependent helicase/DNAse subunit B